MVFRPRVRRPRAIPSRVRAACRSRVRAACRSPVRAACPAARAFRHKAANGGGFGGNAFGGRGTSGTVTKVTTNADGSATVTVTLSKKPANASAASTGFASIQTKVLAADVLIIPTAAIKGSGSSATVQVLSSGKTSTVSVEVGQQSGGESEIVSGLSEGQNVVYTRSFRRGAFPGNGNGPAPGQSGAPFPPGGQSGGQSNGGSL